MASKLEELKDWLNKLPEGSEIMSVATSNYEDDAEISVRTPDGEYVSKRVLDISHG